MNFLRTLFLITLVLAATFEVRATDHPIPLIVVSIDGVRPDYLERFETPNIDWVIANGVTSTHVYSIFPSITFPSHYSIATGLYVENTGIVANNMYDSKMDARFSLGNRSAITNPDWYGGEPIWVTAEKQGLRTGTVFWPGSEAAIKGVHATHWLEYDNSISHDARIDTLVAWFTHPDHERPLSFATLYLSQVDSYGHRYGPDSDSIGVAMREADRVVGRLIEKLGEAGVYPDINIIILSDHGMAATSPERAIILDEIVDSDWYDVYNWNPIGMIQPKEGKLDLVYEALKANEENYTVYKKEDIPDRFRARDHHRIPDIMIVADPEYVITSRSFFENRGVLAGTHGYDPKHPTMHAIFAAHGPGFRSGRTVEPFELVHLYELMCRLLGINPAPNDGDPELLVPALFDPADL